MTRLARPLTWVIAFVVGLVYGIAGTIGQAATWGVLPVGLVIAVIAVAALLVALRLLTGDRWTALAAGMGAMIATLVLSGKGPGGSVVVPAGEPGALTTGIVWTLAVPLLVALVVAWPTRSAARARPARPGPAVGEAERPAGN